MDLSEQVLEDESGRVSVRFRAGRIERVSMRNTWRKSYPDALALSTILSELIRQGLPEAKASDESEAVPFVDPTGAGEVQVNAFWAEFEDYLDTIRLIRERRERGEDPVWDPPTDAVESRKRIFVDYRDGRFQAVTLSPEWLEGVGVQQLNDVCSEFLSALDLVHEPAPDPLWEKAKLQIKRGRNYLAERTHQT